MNKVFIILFFFACSNLHAQEDTVMKSKGYFAFCGGAGIPISSYGFRETRTGNPGYALTGINGDFSVVYEPKDFVISLMGLIRAQDNPMDTRSLTRDFGTANPSSSSWTVNADHWKVTSFMFGVCKALGVHKNRPLSYTFRFLAGGANCVLPQVKAEGSLNGKKNGMVDQSGQTATSIAYLFGAGMRIKLTEEAGILFNVDYFGARPIFRDVISTYGNGNTSTSTLTQGIAIITVSAGMCFQF